MQSSVELREEIATLEAEIMHLERYLLSLYRTAFEGNVTTLSNTPGSYLQYKTESSPKFLSNQLHYKMEPHVCKVDLVHHDKMSPAQGWATSDNQSFAASLKSTSTRVNMPLLSNLDLVNRIFFFSFSYRLTICDVCFRILCIWYILICISPI